MVNIQVVRNSQITISSYEFELRKMMSHLELLTYKFYKSFELLTRWLNFYFSTFKLPTRS